LGLFYPSDHLKGSIMMFGNRSAAFDPITRVNVVDAVDVPAGRMVDVTADDAIHTLPTSLVGKSFLEASDEADSILDLQLSPKPTKTST
jgi:hypothetical protein